MGLSVAPPRGRVSSPPTSESLSGKGIFRGSTRTTLASRPCGRRRRQRQAALSGVQHEIEASFGKMQSYKSKKNKKKKKVLKTNFRFPRRSLVSSRALRRRQRAATLPPGNGGASSDSADDFERGGSESDYDSFPEETRRENGNAPVPDRKWECEHCTYVNKPGTRVCAVCCKTTAKSVSRREKRNGFSRGSNHDFQHSSRRRSSRPEFRDIRQDSEDSRETGKAAGADKRYRYDGEAARRPSVGNDRETEEEEVSAAFRKQIRINSNDPSPSDQKKGRTRKISFWQGAKYFT